MGGNSSKPNVKINFKQHFKIQKEIIFNKEVTKGAKPTKGRSRQCGERNSIVPHINHETFEMYKNNQVKFNTQTLSTNQLANPKLTHQTFNKSNQAALIDNRTKSLVDRYPYTCIGLLQVQFENRRIRGTAFLISSNWLLTCAHNFYDRKEKKMGTSATLTLGLQQKQQTIKQNGKQIQVKFQFGEVIEISAWRLPEQYINLDDQECLIYDFALVKLKNFYDLEQKYGYFGLDSIWSMKKANRDQQLIVAGYPREFKGFNGKCTTLIEGRGPWTEISNDREELKDNERLLHINYRVYTSPGQSGSPIFYETKEKEHYMIGIHTMGGNEENCGVLITPKAREIVNGWIEQMKTIFDISNRNIGDEGMKLFITNFLELSTKITELQLANNRIGPKGIQDLMQTKWTNLKLLNLENNNIKFLGAQSLAHPSNGWNNLEYLNLNNTMIGDNGCCILLKNRAWSRLKELHLKRCSLTTVTVNELIKNQWSCLQTLNIGNNQLTSNDMKILFEMIPQDNKQKKRRFENLRHLNLTKNKIGNQGLQVIVESKYNLQSLNIAGIGIDHLGMEILSKHTWEKLKKLHLDWNKAISIEGIKHLTPEVFPSLSFINLDWTTLGYQGVKILMSHNWKTLKNLSFNHNYLGDQGLNELKSHNALEVLVLQGNNLTTEGIVTFSHKQEWRNLMQLKLRSNHIKKDGFSEIITKLRNLNHLDINNNGLDAHEKRELKELANQQNPNLHIEVDMGEEADYI